MYEVGVHIADVSYFVKAGSSLDEAAARRATSVYLVQRVSSYTFNYYIALIFMCVYCGGMCVPSACKCR